MQEIIVDEGKIKCLISGKYRKETPEEYVRQSLLCRNLLEFINPKKHLMMTLSQMTKRKKRNDIK